MRKKLQPHQKRFLKSVFIAVVILLLPYIYYQPKYEQLKETEITVDWTIYGSGGPRDIHSYIGTTDDTVFMVSGLVSSRSDFESALKPNTTVRIKYYRGLLVIVPIGHIEELIVDGKAIVTYTNGQGFFVGCSCVASGLFLIFEFLLYADSAHLLKKLRNKYWKYKKKRQK